MVSVKRKSKDKLNKYALKFNVDQEKSGIKRMRKVGNEDLEEPMHKWYVKRTQEDPQKPMLSNFAAAAKEDKVTTLINAWKKLLYDIDEEHEFEGEKDAIDEDVEAWLEADGDDPGYHNLTEEEIVDSVHEAADDFDDDEENEDEPPKIKVPEARDCLDTLIKFTHQTKDEKIVAYYNHLWHLMELVIQEQRSKVTQTKIDTFFQAKTFRQCLLVLNIILLGRGGSSSYRHL
ncbi:putative Tigger transposable element-derived protein 7-like 82 [Homarus americanus]|uniref:Putative Tigger transposable element-derived protein 7-like 82 n=1 Tax=Homarus americanus TaxID=6706 RepID=A0A8J5TLD4_HOMAM|nr:putative Tigger transposable element-derived protein 7-like 82 [Homarus americanus]